MRYIFLGYVVAEIAAFWAMAHFLGFAWAFLITIAATGIGYAVLGARARSLGTDIRRAVRREATPGAALTDSALFGVAAVLTILPGIVSTIVGLLLMTRPFRVLMRPAVAAVAARRATLMAERVSVINVGGMPAGFGAYGDDPYARSGHGYVDGTVEGDVVDMTVRNPDGTVHVDQTALPAPSADRPTA